MARVNMEVNHEQFAEAILNYISLHDQGKIKSEEAIILIANACDIYERLKKEIQEQVQLEEGE